MYNKQNGKFTLKNSDNKQGGNRKNIAIQTWDSKISNICTTLHTCVETIVKQYPDMKSTVRR